MEYPLSLNCSSIMLDILLEGVKETIGSAEKSFVTGINSFEEKTGQIFLDTLLKSAPAIYGERGASGIAYRIGEASFRYFLRSQGNEYSLTVNTFRLMNSSNRIIFGLNQLAQFANINSEIKIHISEDENNWYWTTLSGDIPDHASKVYSAYVIGLLREFFLWTSGGRYYPMKDITDTTNQHISLRIAINKKPLDN
jgi:hypothetical protein